MRSKQEIRGIVNGFAKSGMTRRAYCEKHNIGISTLDYSRPAQKKSKPRLVEVAIETEPGWAGSRWYWRTGGAWGARGSSANQIWCD